MNQHGRVRFDARRCPVGAGGLLWFAAFGLALAGCGKDEPLAVGGQPNMVEPDADDREVPEPVEATQQPLKDECSTVADCAYETLDEIRGESDCACAKCPHEVGAVPKSVMEARRQSFKRECRGWLEENRCPPRFCEEPGELACVEGVCRVEK